MAFKLLNHFSIFVYACLTFLLFANQSSCSTLEDELFVKSYGFSPALGTWYGDPTGAGSGGACGWADDVKLAPFSAMIAAGNSRIFLGGKGCGDCYEIKCTKEPYCSGKPIRVTITDECPGACNNVPFHFDLSGTAFGAMAKPGQGYNLRQLGQVDIEFQRVPCNYGRTKIAFKMDSKTNPYWFSTAIQFGDKDGGLKSVEIAPAGSHYFTHMNNIWGAVWVANTDPSFQGPFTFRLTSPTNEVVTARHAVPKNFQPGQTYFSNVNF